MNNDSYPRWVKFETYRWIIGEVSCNFSLSSIVDYADWTGSTIYVWSTGPVDKKTSLSMLRTLYQDFKVSTDVPWLNWPIQVDIVFLVFIRVWDSGILIFLSIFHTFLSVFFFFSELGGLSNVFFIQRLGAVYRFKMDISWIPSAYQTESW